jgi:hypothetical protein
MARQCEDSFCQWSIEGQISQNFQLFGHHGKCNKGPKNLVYIGAQYHGSGTVSGKRDVEE